MLPGSLIVKIRIVLPRTSWPGEGRRNTAKEESAQLTPRGNMLWIGGGRNMGGRVLMQPSKRRNNMAIYKRNGIYFYNFWFNGKHIQASTKQGNPRVARQME